MSVPTPDLAQAVEQIHARIAQAARRAGRDPAEVTLIAVSKTKPAAQVAAAAAAGVRHFGENRIQEAEPKMAALVAHQPPLHWHMIGHVQRNKARSAVQGFALVHALDSLRLARTLDRQRCERLAAPTPLPVLLQVNVSGEASKEGFAVQGGAANPLALDAFCAEVEQILALPLLRVEGLMTVAPWSTDPDQARPVFRTLRLLRDTLAQRFPAASWQQLSMGMTDDFEQAIEEGATCVRIGRAIFGARPSP